jgi:hypothetical protein
MGLTAVLKAITPANGYNNDLSDFTDLATGDPTQRVFRGRNIFGADDPLPCLSILENPHAEDSLREEPRGGGGIARGPWELLIQGFAQDDAQNPSDPAHWLMADVKLALARERAKLKKTAMPATMGGAGYDLFGMGTVVEDMKIGGGVVRPPDDVSAKAFFWLILSLTMAEDTGNPFA